jgi:hypothetical protein
MNFECFEYSSIECAVLLGLIAGIVFVIVVFPFPTPIAPHSWDSATNSRTHCWWRGPGDFSVPVFSLCM